MMCNLANLAKTVLFMFAKSISPTMACNKTFYSSPDAAKCRQPHRQNKLAFSCMSHSHLTSECEPAAYRLSGLLHQDFSVRGELSCTTHWRHISTSDRLTSLVQMDNGCSPMRCKLSCLLPFSTKASTQVTMQPSNGSSSPWCGRNHASCRLSRRWFA